MKSDYGSRIISTCTLLCMNFYRGDTDRRFMISESHEEII
jgi:hypothetical protein